MYQLTNIYVGNQGSGKTYSMMKDTIKIFQSWYCHIVLHVSDVVDQTIEMFKPILSQLSEIELVHVSVDNAEEIAKYIIDNKNVEEYVVVVLDDTTQ